MLLPCVQMHLTSVVESLVRNDRGAWNLGSSVVVQIQVETHQMIILDFWLSHDFIPVYFDTTDTYFKTSFPECLRPYCFKRMMIMFS